MHLMLIDVHDDSTRPPEEAALHAVLGTTAGPFALPLPKRVFFPLQVQSCLLMAELEGSQQLPLGPATPC